MSSAARKRMSLEEAESRVRENPASAVAHLRLGTELLRRQRVCEAEAELRKAIELDETCAGAWVNLGGILLGRFDFQGCVEANRRAAECRPELVEAHYNMGLGQMYLGRAAEMEQCFRRVVELDSGNGGGHYHLAVALHAQGRTAEAYAVYCRALELGFAPQEEFVREMERYAKAQVSPRVVELGGEDNEP